MKPLPPTVIGSWHAQGDFDATSGDAAWAPRETIAAAQAGQNEVGRFQERLEVCGILDGRFAASIASGRAAVAGRRRIYATSISMP